MLKFVSLSIIISVLMLSSCTNTEKKAHENKSVTILDINALEAELFDAKITVPDTTKAKKLSELYIIYADKHPNDSVAPEFLYKAADISMNYGKPKLTIGIFKKLLTSYPDYKNTPTVTFLMGYVYENQLKDYINARKYYTEFIEKYPDSDFADDAKISLENLGKSPEELIKEFEHKIK